LVLLAFSQARTLRRLRRRKAYIPEHNLIAPKSSIIGEISFLIIMQLLALLEGRQWRRAANDGPICLLRAVRFHSQTEACSDWEGTDLGYLNDFRTLRRESVVFAASKASGLCRGLTLMSGPSHCLPA
jgi:hypothetical protein